MVKGLKLLVILDSSILDEVVSKLVQSSTFPLEITKSLTMSQETPADFLTSFDAILFCERQMENVMEQVLGKANSIPMMLFSETQEEPTSKALELIRRGIQDIVTREDIATGRWKRIVRFAIERNRLDSAHARAGLSLLSEASKEFSLWNETQFTRMTAQSFGQKSLRERKPEAYKSMVVMYSGLVQRAVEESVYRQDATQDPKENIRSLSEELGYLYASPRDLIHVHTAGLRYLTQSSALSEGTVYLEESRLILLECMGYLTSFYRLHALPAVHYPNFELQP